MTGGAFYDEAVTAEYLAHRHGGIHSPNTVMEEPALLGAIGDLDGAHVLDLGCGDGRFAEAALERRARSYRGIDASPAMIDTARRTVAGEHVNFECLAIEDLDPRSPAYDVVTSRMALHYVADLADALSRVHDSLRAGGRLVCTVVHPIISSHDNPRPGSRADWTVDRYFEDGPRQRLWFGKEVTWYHRTIEQYVRTMSGAGFRLDELSECAPDPASWPTSPTSSIDGAAFRSSSSSAEPRPAETPFTQRSTRLTEPVRPALRTAAFVASLLATSPPIR